MVAMKVYCVIGTAPAHMGKSIVEAGITTVLHSFVATKGDKPIPLDELSEIMYQKVEQPCKST